MCKLRFVVLMLLSFLWLSPALADIDVSRAQITSGIDNREPIDRVEKVFNDVDKVYFFTEFKGMKGRSVLHRWEQGGIVRAEVVFNIGADRWRVWSSKNMYPTWLGEWKVSVVDDDGNILAQESFDYVPVELKQ